MPFDPGRDFLHFDESTSKQRRREQRWNKILFPLLFIAAICVTVAIITLGD